MTTSDYLTQLQTDKSNMVTNLTTKGISGLTGNETFTELVPEILNIPSGGSVVEEKDVNFYDYDGTLLDSYTKQEFLALESMPANPSHEGLTAQGWNWTLTDAQNYVTTYNILDIGQHYDTTNGELRIYIDIPEERKTFYVNYNHVEAGSTQIDWGDGTTETATSSSTNVLMSKVHTYSTSGKYVIKIQKIDNNSPHVVLQGNTTNGSNLITGEVNASSRSILGYTQMIYKLELGSIVQASTYGLSNLVNLETITVNKNFGFDNPSQFMPNCTKLKAIVLSSIVNTRGNANGFENCTSLKVMCINFDSTSTTAMYLTKCVSLKRITGYKYITAIANNFATECYSLEEVALPNTLTSISGMAFQYCEKLKSINIPNTVTTINQAAFSNCKSLESIVIPNYVTTLGMQAFQYCKNLKYVKMSKNISEINGATFQYCTNLISIDFSENESIPSLTTTAFSNVTIDYKIIVPDNLYDDWIATTGWSNYASKIVRVSDV